MVICRIADVCVGISILDEAKAPRSPKSITHNSNVNEFAKLLKMASHVILKRMYFSRTTLCKEATPSVVCGANPPTKNLLALQEEK